MSLENPHVDKYQDALTSRRWCFTLWEPPETGEKTVLEYLEKNLVHIKSDSWTLRCNFGGVYFNGRRILADKNLEYPGRIEYFEPKFAMEDAASYFPQITEANIIFRRDGILAVNKPEGLPSLPSKDQLAYNLRTQLYSLLGHDISLHMPSRLDTSVSGLILISEDDKLHGSMQLLFEKKRITKRYLAIVSPIPSWDEREINLPIGRDPNWGVLRKIDQISGKPSVTNIKKLSSFCDLDSKTPKSLVAAYPLTGRTHQIRLHLSACGFPILGDKFYGGVEAAQLHLLSESVSFRHPITGEDLKIQMPSKSMPDWLNDVY